MINSDEIRITAAPETARAPDENAYIVTVNEAGQHAIWPAELNLPAGWRRKSAAMARQGCLDAVAAGWRDIAPVRRGGGGPTRVHERTGYVHDVIHEQAARRPHAPAVVAAGAQLTYQQLDQSANQLAHYLRARGVGPETLVGVSLDRGVEAIRCLLAILKAGGAYLPLEPTLPAARRTQMCQDVRPTVILADRADGTAFGDTGARLLLIDEMTQELAGQPVTAPEARLQPDNLAYAIHTSGSTGQPKAVGVSHGSLACVSQEAARRYRISSEDRVLQLAALGFDTSVEQILVPLLSGATLMLPAAGTVAPTELLGYLASERITVIDLIPAYWHELLARTEPGDDRLQSVRLMITGGELANRADCEAAMRAVPGGTLMNAYGLTETTITSAVGDLGQELAAPEGARPEAASPEPGALVPVGTPLPHTQILVLDADLNVLPPGRTGEVYIGGCGVARGYLGRPGLTAQLFLPNPHSPVPGSRMYRTGDLGRWRADQNLEVIGRTDRQLKIRGFRVEPAEIESVLTSHPAITEAAVVAYEAGSGHRQLAAYYADRTGELDATSLHSFVAARLPAFMVPAVFIPVARIPRTSGGTADRGALPSPGPAPRVDTDDEQTLLQAGMSHLWSTLLKTAPVRLDDDFFQLGGNSLLAAEMLTHVRVMFGISANDVRPLTRCLLRERTLRAFSNATRDARAGRLTADRAEPRPDFGPESALDHPIRVTAGPAPDWRRPHRILLTGTTGFLGIHLLRELLAATTAQIHCLVRAPDTGHALRRIAEAASRYELGDLAFDRVVPVPGDLAEPDLGLAPHTFDDLARTIDVIHHAGAIVNFIYPYEELRAANVTGTRELIRLAGLYRGIPIHYVSTTTVLAGFGVMGVHEVTEDTPLAHASQLCMGYIETKFVAEELLRNAGRAGLPVAIYRPLDIVGDHRTGAWNTATEMCALIRFITDAGMAPDIDLPLDFVPADICAAAIRHIASHAGADGRTYHLASPRYALLAALIDRLRAHGFAVKEIPYRDWVDELLRYAAHNPAHPMTPFVPLFVDRDTGTGLTVAEMYLDHVFPSYTRSHTEQALTGSGIAFPAAEELLDVHITRLIATGYLKKPAEGRSPDGQAGRNAG